MYVARIFVLCSAFRVVEKLRISVQIETEDYYYYFFFLIESVVDFIIELFFSFIFK